MKQDSISRKQETTYPSISHIAYRDGRDEYYCRAVHSVLQAAEDGFFCGKGCPCFAGRTKAYGKDCPICQYCDVLDSAGFKKNQNEKLSIMPEKEKEQTQEPDCSLNGNQVYARIQGQIEKKEVPLFPEVPGISSRLQKAYQFAAEAHKNQLRKGRKIPYMSHLLQTANYACLLTDKEEIIIAALLHDTIEDTKTTKKDIEEQFGAYIANLVADDSEDKRRGQNPCDTWEIRKKENLDRLKDTSYEVKLVVISDKTANLSSLANERKIFGDAMWQHFNQKDAEKQKWYYCACRNALKELENTPVMKIYDQFYEEVFGT